MTWVNVYFSESLDQDELDKLPQTLKIPKISSLTPTLLQIAESHSGELWRGKWQGNDIVARILNVQEVTARISRDFQTEFPALRIFAHPNICAVLAAANQPPNLVIISQYMPFGSLYNVLHEQSCEFWRFSLKRAQKLVLENVLKIFFFDFEKVEKNFFLINFFFSKFVLFPIFEIFC